MKHNPLTKEKAIKFVYSSKWLSNKHHKLSNHSQKNSTHFGCTNHTIPQISICPIHGQPWRKPFLASNIHKPQLHTKPK